MLNINCSSSDCIYMRDGKCCLDTVTENTKRKTDTDDKSRENPNPCPYYVNVR